MTAPRRPPAGQAARDANRPRADVAPFTWREFGSALAVLMRDGPGLLSDLELRHLEAALPVLLESVVVEKNARVRPGTAPVGDAS